MSSNFTALAAVYMQNIHGLNNLIMTQKYLNSMMSFSNNNQFNEIFPQNITSKIEAQSMAPKEQVRTQPLFQMQTDHASIKNENISNNLIRFPVPVDSKGIHYSKGNLENHELIEENGMTNTSEDKMKSLLGKKSSSKKFKCEEPECRRSFAKKSQLLDHQKVHLKTVYTCSRENCKSSFNYLENLVKHEKMHEQKPFKCPLIECGKSFSVLFNYQVFFQFNIIIFIYYRDM
jgi:hypothetical protein